MNISVASVCLFFPGKFGLSRYICVYQDRISLIFPQNLTCLQEKWAKSERKVNFFTKFDMFTKKRAKMFEIEIQSLILMKLNFFIHLF